MTSPAHIASQSRSLSQRIGDLTRERDRISKELVATKRLLGSIREIAFGAGSSLEGFSEIRQALGENWETATPPGRTFDLMRSHDGSGVSGAGRVAEGFEFEGGKVALCWLGRYSSVNVYDSVDHVKHIHGHGGATEVVFRDA